MHIFCRETEAHLEVHPHLPGEDKSSGSLITPELWLKNCKSPDSGSPSPPGSPRPQENRLPPAPLISVAPASKLMAINDAGIKRHKSKIQRKQRKRHPANYSICETDVNTELPQDLRVRQPSNDKHNESISSAREAGISDGRVKQTDACPVNNHMYHNSRFHQPRVLPLNQPTLNLNSGLPKNLANLPPVTVLVPYPVVVPFPVPIPIPIPLLKEIKEKQKEETNGEEEASKSDLKLSDINEAKAQLREAENLESDDEVKNGITRPLRKRKRLIDTKSRIPNKKKSLAV